MRQITTFETAKTRNLYPKAPQIWLRMQWVPNEYWLLVQVYPQPWGEGTLQPTGDLYLIDNDIGYRRLLQNGGDYAYYSINPNGKQIATISTAAMNSSGTENYSRIQEGTLSLIDLSSEDRMQHIQLQLTKNPSTITAPIYSPDGARVALQDEIGLAVINTHNGQSQQIPIVNPCAEALCHGGGYLPVIWQPDGESLYTLTSKNNFYDIRAETTLSRIQLEPALKIDTLLVLHANPETFSFSPDLRILSYWNQPDFDTSGGDMNWVTLYLMDLQEGKSKRYIAQYELRIIGWNPDNQHFIYVYSQDGGSTLVTDQLALGSICQQPRSLSAPAEGTLINHVRWTDSTHFLTWTIPVSGTPDRYTIGQYLYSITGKEQPIHIGDQLIDMLEPYGRQSQVLVLD